MKQIALIAFMAIIAVAALNACGGPISQQPTPSANHEAALRNPPVELYPKPPAKTEGSLFSDDVTAAEFFTDVKAVNVGDIVTINIVETSKASKDAKTDLERNNEVDAAIKALLGFETYSHPLVQELAPNSTWAPVSRPRTDPSSRAKAKPPATKA